MVKTTNINSVGKVLNNISNTSNLRKTLSEVNNLENIDTVILDKLNGLKNKRDELNNKKVSAGALIHISEVDEINETSILQLERAKSIVSKLNFSKNMSKAIDTSNCPEISNESLSAIDRLKKVKDISDKNTQYKSSVKQINDYCDQVLNYMKQCGVAFETCPNCGNDVLIDIDKIS